MLTAQNENLFMRKLLVLVLFYSPILISAQRNYTAEVSRLADLGKIWGILHNFHPSMVRGTERNGGKIAGSYSTHFSGLEVLYPDGSQTQQTGIRINIKVEPTVAALKQGKDEVLQRAIQFIQSGK